MVFRDNYAHLRDTIQAPEDVANRLFSSGTIDSHTRDKVQLNTLTVSKKCEELLKAIEHGISADPRVFYRFIEILCEEPTTEKLGNRLLYDVRSKLASYPYCIARVLHQMCCVCNLLCRRSANCPVSSRLD